MKQIFKGQTISNKKSKSRLNKETEKLRETPETPGRRKLFVSYSHRDRPWLDRLKVHLALLERRDLVNVWSDTLVGVGTRWQDEIDIALTEARIAVLLISADFLASHFIWDKEMARFLEHEEHGMVLLPLIVRPCAWRIAPELAGLQARPLDGRPLSLGTEAEVDRDLAEFVYEVAYRIEQLPANVPYERVEEARATRRLSVSGRPYSSSAGADSRRGTPNSSIAAG